MTDSLNGCPICGKAPGYEFIPEREFGEWDTHAFVCFEPKNHAVKAIGTTRKAAAETWNRRAS